MLSLSASGASCGVKGPRAALLMASLVAVTAENHLWKRATEERERARGLSLLAEALHESNGHHNGKDMTDDGSRGFRFVTGQCILARRCR